MNRKISSALISVYYKDNLEPLINTLRKYNVKLYSTGGTQKFIEDLGAEVTAVEDITGYPSILGGRVKTLHPKVFGGILGRRDNEQDKKEMSEYDIPDIDLVVVDLYPFEQTVASGAEEQDIIEKIDIGGISLIRGAAKNYKDVTIIASREQYQPLVEVMEKNNGATTIEDRKSFAAHAFDISSHYDSAIYNYFNKDLDLPSYKQSLRKHKALRYGENPHQKGAFFGDLESLFLQLNGKELSYNNLLDIDAAVGLIDEFKETTFAILKHNNACGVGTASSVKEAYKKALAGDPVSAFGGVLITNKPIDTETAEEMHKLFFEVVIAPAFDQEALDLLSQKKNRIILKRKNAQLPERTSRTLLNGVIVQDKDVKTENFGDLKTSTEKEPSLEEKKALIFAAKICKHSKSNAIVLAKEDQLISSGVGETSRIDALKHAIEKAKHFNFDLSDGVVMASDAFFPFPDCVEIAHKEGIVSVIQPGGSIKDKDSVEYCNKNNMSMVFTGLRHFKH